VDADSHARARARPTDMRVIAAYMMAVLGGNANPSAKDVLAILDSVGAKAGDDEVNRVVSALQGVYLLRARSMPSLPPRTARCGVLTRLLSQARTSTS
jgi:hypothetical protein